jgi:hypothetical protein
MVWQCTKLQNSTHSGSAFIRTWPQNFTPSPFLKASSKKTIIQIKLVGTRMFMIFHCTKLNLNKCNSSWVVFMKQNVNYNNQPPALFSAKVVSLKVVHPFKSCQYTQFYGPNVDCCRFCIRLRSSNVRHFGMVEATRLTIMTSWLLSMTWPPYWM